MAGTELLVEVGDDNFEQEIEQHQGVALVDFWAAWCGPCQMIAPHVAQLAQDYEGRVKVAKLDVDNNQKTSMRFNIRSIPSLLVFKDGSLVDTVVGLVAKEHLANAVEKHL
jgi:thioredoxin 1